MATTEEREAHVNILGPQHSSSKLHPSPTPNTNTTDLSGQIFPFFSLCYQQFTLEVLTASLIHFKWRHRPVPTLSTLFLLFGVYLRDATLCCPHTHTAQQVGFTSADQLHDPMVIKDAKESEPHFSETAVNSTSVSF